MPALRSPRAIAGASVLIIGVPVAFAAGILFDAGASEILHVAMGASFLLIAWAVSDFRTPAWTVPVARAGIGAVGAIFLLQGVSDIAGSAALANIAYGVLGGPIEKALGYVFLAWCAVVLITDSAGLSRTLGGVALAVVAHVEAYRYVTAHFGTPTSEAVMLLYLPVFAWLLLEAAKPRPG